MLLARWRISFKNFWQAWHSLYIYPALFLILLLFLYILRLEEVDTGLDSLMPTPAQLQRIVTDSRKGLKVQDPKSLSELDLKVYDVRCKQA